MCTYAISGSRSVIRECRVVRLDRVAELDVARRNHAVDRRANFGVAQFEARAVVGRAQRVEVELGVLGGALGDESLVAEVELALVVALELAQVRIDLGERRGAAGRRRAGPAPGPPSRCRLPRR